MGNIISMLAGELMSGSSVKQVAKAANVNEKQAENIMGNAIPLLVQAMSDNAGTKVGAESLYEALGQHNNGLSAAEQLDRADLEDGDRIIGKILGDNKQGVTEALAKQAGVTKGNSAKILALLAPVILSLISTETNTNNTSSGGLSSLLSLFTDDDTGHSNTQTTSSSGLGDIGTALLMGALLGNNNNGNSGSAGGNLLTSLLGGGQQQVQSQQQQSGGLLESLLGGGMSGQTIQSGGSGLDGALLNNNTNPNSINQGSMLSSLLSGSNNDTSNMLGSLAGSLLADAFKGMPQQKAAPRKAAAKKTTAAKPAAKKTAAAAKKTTSAKKTTAKKPADK